MGRLFLLLIWLVFLGSYDLLVLVWLVFYFLVKGFAYGFPCIVCFLGLGFIVGLGLLFWLLPWLC